jgi:hypothetical protein
VDEPRINVYICQKCGGHTVTVDVDEGVTPFMIGCRSGHFVKFGRGKARVKKSCNGMAHSSFYPRGPKPDYIKEPAWEWFKPTDADLEALYRGDLLEQMREHVEKGGLILRRRTKRPARMHGALAKEAVRTEVVTNGPLGRQGEGRGGD